MSITVGGHTQQRRESLALGPGVDMISRHVAGELAYHMPGHLAPAARDIAVAVNGKDRELAEGAQHVGMSALIDFVGRK